MRVIVVIKEIRLSTIGKAISNQNYFALTLVGKGQKVYDYFVLSLYLNNN